MVIHSSRQRHGPATSARDHRVPHGCPCPAAASSAAEGAPRPRRPRGRAVSREVAGQSAGARTSRLARAAVDQQDVRGPQQPGVRVVVHAGQHLKCGAFS
ncbi:hypothetical protein QJS66_11440 [Kocuria rhizophila]|nr:hypothetical protein QJS66_11440 [Kocuria rhizophila]